MTEMEIRQYGMTECYIEIEEMIKKACYNFRKKYGGDIEELIAEANLHFVYAWEHYESSKGEFHKWIYGIIYLRLLETVRKRCYRNARIKQVWEDIESTFSKPEFSMMEFVDELSTDAQVAIDLILGARRDLQVILFEYESTHIQDIKRALRSTLRDLGWDRERISTSFREIKEALK